MMHWNQILYTKNDILCCPPNFGYAGGTLEACLIYTGGIIVFQALDVAKEINICPTLGTV